MMSQCNISSENTALEPPQLKPQFLTSWMLNIMEKYKSVPQDKISKLSLILVQATYGFLVKNVGPQPVGFMIIIKVENHLHTKLMVPNSVLHMVAEVSQVSGQLILSQLLVLLPKMSFLEKLHH